MKFEIELCKESCLIISNDIESEYAFNNMPKQIRNLMPKKIAVHKLFSNTESYNVLEKRVLDIFFKKQSTSRSLAIRTIWEGL